MPALKEEPQLYPQDIFEEPTPVEISDESSWWVLHTRPRSEKALARMLRAKQTAYFLPQGKTKRYVQRRCVTTIKPLFPGYLFLYGSSKSYEIALQTRKVVSRLEVSDQRRLQEELAKLHFLITREVPLEAESGFAKGTQVEITEGSLKGLVGKVTRRDGVSRVILEIQMLNQGVSVQVEDWMLRKV